MQTDASDVCYSCPYISHSPIPALFSPSPEASIIYSCVLINSTKDIWLFSSISRALGGVFTF